MQNINQLKISPTAEFLVCVIASATLKSVVNAA